MPSEILSNPGRLSTTQFELIKEHSQTGHDIMSKIEFPWPIADMILQLFPVSTYETGMRY